jgi:hypothetical protein
MLSFNLSFFICSFDFLVFPLIVSIYFVVLSFHFLDEEILQLERRFLKLQKHKVELEDRLQGFMKKNARKVTIERREPISRIERRPIELERPRFEEPPRRNYEHRNIADRGDFEEKEERTARRSDQAVPMVMSKSKVTRNPKYSDNY